MCIRDSSQIPGDEENKRRIVRRYASLIVSDIRKQIYEHMDRKTQDVHIIQKDIILFRKFVKNVKEDGRVRYDKPFTDKSNIKTYLFTGYKTSYYPANAFDSDTERLFSIILEEDTDAVSYTHLRTLRKDVAKYMNFKKRTCKTVDFTLSQDEIELYQRVNYFLKRELLYSCLLYTSIRSNPRSAYIV